MKLNKTRITALIAALCVAATMGTTTAFAASANDRTPTTSTLAPAEDSSVKLEIQGGFTQAKNPTITKKIKTLCDKAFDEIEGCTYTPVALLGTQAVAGTNYCILFKVTPVVPNAKETYVIGTIYENLEGKATCIELLDSNLSTDLNQEDGAYVQPSSPKVSKYAKAALTKALNDMVGAEYTPIAQVSKQVVAGVNYRILCNITPVYPNAEGEYAIVTVHKDTSGKATITNIADFSKE